jgi:hypothetical protein
MTKTSHLDLEEYRITGIVDRFRDSVKRDDFKKPPERFYPLAVFYNMMP